MRGCCLADSASACAQACRAAVPRFAHNASVPGNEVHAVLQGPAAARPGANEGGRAPGARSARPAHRAPRARCVAPPAPPAAPPAGGAPCVPGLGHSTVCHLSLRSAAHADRSRRVVSYLVCDSLCGQVGRACQVGAGAPVRSRRRRARLRPPRPQRAGARPPRPPPAPCMRRRPPCSKSSSTGCRDGPVNVHLHGSSGHLEMPRMWPKRPALRGVDTAY